MAVLVLINGVPASGKSTIATRMALADPEAFVFDLDEFKHRLPEWTSDPTGAGAVAREHFLAEAQVQLRSGKNVYLGQYLAMLDFIEQLVDLARRTDARSIELILLLDAEHVTSRLAERARHPDRPEHAVNNRLVSVEDVPALIESIEAIHKLRPTAIGIDASGSVEETAALVRRQVLAE